MNGYSRWLPGVRLGMFLVKDYDHDTTNYEGEDPYSSERTESRTDLYIGLTVGGEYFLSSRFSLGAEGQINRIAMGDPDVTYTSSNDDGDDSEPGSSHDLSLASNNMMVFLRFYFN